MDPEEGERVAKALDVSIGEVQRLAALPQEERVKATDSPAEEGSHDPAFFNGRGLRNEPRGLRRDGSARE
jgi:hypothetical protein